MSTSGDGAVRKGPQGDCDSWDPGLIKTVKSPIAATAKRCFRPEVRGMQHVPLRGAALVVSNHSGGMWTPDFPIFATDFYDAFGYDRPLYCLAHNALFVGPMGQWMPRLGVIHAGHENVATAPECRGSCHGVPRR